MVVDCLVAESATISSGYPWGSPPRLFVGEVIHSRLDDLLCVFQGVMLVKLYMNRIAGFILARGLVVIILV